MDYHDDWSNNEHENLDSVFATLQDSLYVSYHEVYSTYRIMNLHNHAFSIGKPVTIIYVKDLNFKIHLLV